MSLPATSLVYFSMQFRGCIIEQLYSASLHKRHLKEEVASRGVPAMAVLSVGGVMQDGQAQQKQS